MPKHVDHENVPQELTVTFAYNEHTFRTHKVELGDVVKAFIDVARGMAPQDITEMRHRVQAGPRQVGDVELTEKDDMLITYTYVSHKGSVINELDQKMLKAIEPFRKLGGLLIEHAVRAFEAEPVTRGIRSRKGSDDGGRGGGSGGSGRGLLN